MTPEAGTAMGKPPEGRSGLSGVAAQPSSPRPYTAPTPGAIDLAGLADHLTLPLLHRLPLDTLGWPVGPTRLFPIEEATLPALRALGVEVTLQGASREPGAGNVILLPTEGVSCGTILLTLVGARGAVVAHGGGSAERRMEITIEGEGNACLLGHSRFSSRYNIQIRARDSGLLVGRDCSGRGIKFQLDGQGRRLVMGRGCMMGPGVTIRTSDSHGIVDLATGAHTNPPRDVRIGDHVWLSHEAMVLRGVTIGAGSVVAMRGLVTRNVPPRCLVAGIPARVVRREVSWTRESMPGERQVAMLRAELDLAMPQDED
jgi:acetyltransferase-like isoleucine patch superfamily enzyme